MVKAIWAVACPVLAVAILFSSFVFAQDGPPSVENPAVAQPGEQVDVGYKLGPEDLLRISVWDNKELTLVDGRDKLMQSNYSGFNGAPLFDKNSGDMIVSGENGLLYTMETTGNLVAVLVKLASGMQHGHHHFKR